jgi:uncharacterized caspase-like protein
MPSTSEARERAAAAAPVCTSGLVGRLAAAALVCIAAIACAAPRLAVAATPDGAPRVALVIGNAGYRTLPLSNPLNDARAVADTLNRLGFKVISVQDASQKRMFDAVREFGDALHGGVGLFYYAGHGVQVKGRNYLIPVDAQIEREDEVPYKAFDVGLVLEKMEAAKNPLNVVILDACRNNPFARGSRSASTGLAQIDAPAGSIVAFATAPGAEAADGAGANGLYTSYLLQHMTTPGLKVEEVFKRTRVAVKQGSSGRQIPWESTSLEGDFYFVPPAAGSVPEPAGSAAVENELWSVISRSNSPSAYLAYLEKYPDGRYAGEARAKARTATVADAAVSPAPAPRPNSRSQGGFSFSAEEQKMDRATPEGRAQAFEQAVGATACPPARRNARVRVQLVENPFGAAGSRGGAFATVLAQRLRQAGMRVMPQGTADYVVQGTITAQANLNRHLDVNEVAVSGAITLASAQGLAVSSQVSREESYAGSDVQAAYLDLVHGQASDVAARLFADLCRH